MKYGDIFKAITGEDPTKIDLEAIEKKAIKEIKFKRYGKRIVSDRGNIFKNKFFDVNKKIDQKLASL